MITLKRKAEKRTAPGWVLIAKYGNSIYWAEISESSQSLGNFGFCHEAGNGDDECKRTLAISSYAIRKKSCQP